MQWGDVGHTQMGMNEQNNWVIITKKKKKIIFVQNLSCNMFLHQF